MNDESMLDHAEHYLLATGGKGAQRLRLLHEVYGFVRMQAVVS